GYPGTTEIILAMERGELQGIGDWSWSSLKAARPDWLRDKKITLLLQAALHKEPELAGLPSALDFVKNDAERKVMELYLTQKTLARPLIAPPGIAPERLTTLKAAFAALAHDNDFLADARTAGIDVSPLAGEAVDRIIAMISSAPPETTDRLGKAIGSEKGARTLRARRRLGAQLILEAGGRRATRGPRKSSSCPRPRAPARGRHSAWCRRNPVRSEDPCRAPRPPSRRRTEYCRSAPPWS